MWGLSGLRGLSLTLLPVEGSWCHEASSEVSTICAFGWSLDYIRSLNPKPQQHPTHSHIVAIVVPFAGYLMGSYMWNWLNQKQELQ